MTIGSGVGRRLTHIDDISQRALILIIVAVLFPVFLLTAQRQAPYHIDPFTNVLTAAAIGQTGSPILTGNEALADPSAFRVVAWVRPSPRGPVSQYPPGAALAAAPFYVLADAPVQQFFVGTNDPSLPPVPVQVPSGLPAAIAAALATSLAVAFSVASTRSLIGVRGALLAGAVLAAGTPLWVTASHQLWQHGVAGMWIALSLFLASRRTWFGSGLAMGMAILTRPTVAVVAAVVGAISGWRARDLRPTMLHGLGATLGMLALLAFNWWVWGEWTVSGGYGDGFSSRLAGSPDFGIAWYSMNVLGGLFSLDRGIVIWSPVLVAAAVGLPAVWRNLPAWASGAFLGGLLLLLLQWRLNRYSGGEGFASYRYPIETVVAMAPALGTAASKMWQRGPGMRRLIIYSAAASVAFHLTALAMQTRT